MALTFSITDKLSAFDVYIIAKTRLIVNGLKSIKIEVCKNTHTLRKPPKCLNRIIHNCHYEKNGNSEPVLLEDLPFDIPANWSWVKISGLFALQTGASFKKETAMADKSKTRILRGGNIQRGTYSFLDNDIFIKENWFPQAFI